MKWLSNVWFLCGGGEKEREQVDIESLNSYLFEEVHQVCFNNPISSLNILVLLRW